jgi:MFS family permease
MWVTLVALSLSNIVEQIDRYVFQVSPVPFISYDSYEYSLLAGTLFSVVYCVGVILFALLNERVQMNRVTIVALSCSLSSISLLFVPFTTKFWQVALLRLLMGFAQSPITTFAASIIKDCFHDETRGMAFGIFTGATFFGFALSLTLGTLLFDSTGWKSSYILFGILGLIYALLFKLFIADPSPIDYNTENKGGDGFLGSNISDDDSVIQDPLVHNYQHPASQAAARQQGVHENYEYLNNSMDPMESDIGNHHTGPMIISKKNCSNIKNIQETLADFIRIIGDVWTYCSRYSSIFYMCIGCGLRFAGGYQYANYIAIFFSDKYNTNIIDGKAQVCSYSYDIKYEGANDPGFACGEDFPYCIDGQCNQLNSFPWHDVGMPHDQFETAFALSTIIGSVIGCLLGGYLGDWIAKNTKYGVSGRMIIAGISLLISAPMYLIMYHTLYPTCFIFLGLGGLFGEMYYGLSIAVLAEMIPKKLFPVTTSLYISLLIAFGSNGTLLVPMVTNWLEYGDSVTFEIDAACTEANAQNESTPGIETFTATQHGDKGLQSALSWLICIFYIIAGVLFLVSVPMVERDLKIIKKSRNERNPNYNDVDGYVENAISH